MTRHRPLLERSPHALPLGLLALLVLALFADVAVGGRILFERDVHVYWYGQIVSLARCVREGSWPLWDPFVSFGEPLLANPSAQVLYPTTWVAIFMDPGRAYAAYALVHLLVAGAGLYFLALRLGLTRTAATFAAGCWVTTGPVLSLVSLWHHLAGAAFLPWCLLVADRALRTPTRRHFAAWASVFALQILAGSADMCAMTLVVTAAHGAWLARSRGLAMPVGRTLAAAAAALGTAGALTALLWLPALEQVRRSSRSHLPPQLRAFWSTDPAVLLQAALPILPVDLPLSKAGADRFFESREPFLGSIYLGLAAMPLVASALVGRKEGFPRFLLAAVLLGAVAVALGRHGGIYDALVTVAPPLRVLRYPVKATVIAAWAWALLVGRGVDAWAQDRSRRLRRAAFAAGLPCVVLGVVAVAVLKNPTEGLATLVRCEEGQSAREVMAPAAHRVGVATVATAVTLGLATLGAGAAPVAGLVAVMDLALAHRDLNPTAPPALLTPPSLLPLGNANPPTRLYVFDYGPRLLGRAYRRPPLDDAFWATPEVRRSPLVRARELREIFVPPSAREWGLYGSYGQDMLALDPQPLVNLNLLLRASEETEDHLRLLRLGSVDEVVALHDEGLESLPLLARRPTRLGRPVRVFRVSGRLPRVHVVGGSRVASGAAAYRVLLDPAFDPWTEVLLGEGAERTRVPGFFGGAQVVERLYDRLRIAADLSHDGYLLVTDRYDPGWRAIVDGVPRPILPANLVFRAVALPAGRHHVEMVYRPPAVWIGLRISVTSALAFLVFTTMPRRRSA